MKAHYVHPETKKTIEIEVTRMVREESQRQIKDIMERFYNDLDAIILWALHEHFGFGAERLHRFYLAFTAIYKDLRDFYEMGSDTPYVCKVKLRDIGVDLEAWQKEVDENEKNTDAV